MGCRHQGGVIFHRLFADGRRFHPGKHVHFGGVHDVRIIFLFHDYRTVHGGVLGLCLGLCSQREGDKHSSCEDILFLFHNVLYFLLQFLQSFVNHACYIVVGLVVLLQAQ